MSTPSSVLTLGLKSDAGLFLRLGFGLSVAPVVSPADVGWRAGDPGRVWAEDDPGRTWIEGDPGRTWVREADAMTVVVIEKLSDWDRAYFWDFSDFEEFSETPAQTIASVTGIAVLPATGLTVGTGAVSGTQVRAEISGGTAGLTYQLHCTILTSGGKTLSLIGGLFIAG